MINSHHPHHPHQTRHYIIMITLVLGGIFLLLLFNENSSTLTSAMVGITGNESIESLKTGIIEGTSNVINGKEVNEIGGKEVLESLPSTDKIDFVLEFDQIPFIENDVKAKSLKINFTKQATKIDLNEDQLDLESLEEVDLELIGYEGKLKLEDYSLTIFGKAKKIKINGITLSAKENLEINFNKLVYEDLSVEEVNLEQINFPRGDGYLEIADKLTYNVVSEEIIVGIFEGNMYVNKNADNKFQIEGSTKVMKSSGETLNLKLN